MNGFVPGITCGQRHMTARWARHGRALAVIRMLASLCICFIAQFVHGSAEADIAQWPADLPVDTAPGEQGIGRMIEHPGISLAADGAGGAFIAWEDSYGLVFIGRIDSSGTLLWSDGPVSPLLSSNPVVVTGANGSVILAWIEWNTVTGFDIFAQSYDSSGNPLWPIEGVPVTTVEANQGVTGIAIDSDGSGGAILAWEDARPSCCKVYAQRILADGTPAWTVDGIRISPEPTIVFGPMGEKPRILGDGAGGALISWVNDQVDPNTGDTHDILLQRADENGNLVWPSPGIRVGPASYARYSLISDGAGGAIVAFSGPSDIDEWSDIFAQRIAANGTVVWPVDGVRLADTLYYQRNPYAVTDGNGGAIVVWPTGPQCTSSFGECDIFAQRIDANGNPVWQHNGIPISVAPNNQRLPVAVSDGSGGAIIAWTDCRYYPDRDPCLAGVDIYAQHVNGDGQVLGIANGVPATQAPGNQGTDFGSEQDPGLVMISDGAGGAILAWPDGRNGFCVYTVAITECDVFAQRIAGFTNSAPIATADSHETSEDVALTVAAPGVLGNDSDPDDDALTANLLTQPLNGSVVLNANGRFTYTPRANFYGSDSFTYRASDGQVTSASATVTIAVNSVNDAPVASADSYGTAPGLPLAVAAPGILGNDSDVDGDSLTASLETGPANGSLTLNADGSFTYVPSAGFAGTDSFTYRANDGTVESSATTVSINVDVVSVVHVGDLDRQIGADASGWWAQATVRVHSANHRAVSGVIVTGTWTGGTNGTAQCTTNGNGYCNLKVSAIPASVSNVTFTVDNLSKAGRFYSSAANHDPDGDSSGTTIAISSPFLIHVSDLDRQIGTDAMGWWAQVTVRVHSTTHGAVVGAAVTGSWNGGTTGTVQCTTNSRGYCSLKASGIPTALFNVVFTVNELSKPGRIYASGANHDPDGDSTGTAITIDSPLLIHVGDLDTRIGTDASGWWAQATIRVHNTTHGAVAGALVTASWSDGVAGMGQCTTNSRGYCNLRAEIPASVTSITLTIDDVVKAERFYSSGMNHDSDGDSNGTIFTISSPLLMHVGDLDRKTGSDASG